MSEMTEAELGDLVRAYEEATTSYDTAAKRLQELNDKAEEADDYTEADDFRHYDYAEATENALGAAQRLLSTLGYAEGREVSR